MMGTFGGALEARKIDASGGRLTAEAIGEIESDDGVLVIKRIHVRMRLKAPLEVKDVVERVHGFFANKCPVFRSIRAAIEVTSSYELDTEGA